MKKYITLAFILICSIPIYGELSKELTISYDVSDFSVEEFNGQLYINSSLLSLSYSQDTLAPALPYVNIYVLIDAACEYVNHTISFNEVLIRNNANVAPNPHLVPSHVADVSNLSRIDHYSQLEYPVNPVVYQGTYVMGDYKMLGFSVCPFRYNTTNKLLYLKTEIDLSISLSTNISNNLKKPNRNMRESVSRLVLNSQDLPSLYEDFGVSGKRENPRSTTPVYDYLIITCDSLKEEFQKLADWKTTKGVRTKVLTVEDIYSNFSGARPQLKIKQAIKDYYDNSNHALQYVLLGGDHEIVPAELCRVTAGWYNNGHYVTERHDIPADLFYACLDVVDWDTNGNGKIGEISDNVDYSYDVVATRLSVNSKADAYCQIQRIINYERVPQTENWENDILLAGQTLHDRHYDYPEGRMSDTEYKSEKYLYKKYIKDKWPNHVRLKFYDTGTSFPGGSSYNFRVDNLQEQIARQYKIINIVTHGSYDAWVMEWTGSFQCYFVDDARLSENHGHTIIVTSACQTNGFSEADTCLSEAFMRNPDGGVIAYYGCSHYGWASSDSIAENLSDRFNGIMYSCLLTNSSHQLGRAVYDSKMTFLNTVYINNKQHWLMCGLNALCDPEMPVFLSEPQRFNSVNVSFSNGILNVNTNLEGCRICVMSKDDAGDSYYNVTDSTSTGVYSLSPGTYTVCVTKQGYVPYMAVLSEGVIYLQNETFGADTDVFADRVLIGKDVTNDKDFGPVLVSNGKTRVRATKSVTIANDFEVTRGAQFQIMTGN